MRLKKSGHVAIAFFAALLWIWGSLQTLDGLARAQPPPPAPTGATGDPFNGAACPFGFGLWPPAEITRQVVPAAGVGACWVRVNVYWDEIEPLKTTPRTYHWAETDSRLLSVRQAGLEPVALVGANPAWAADTPGGPVTDTQDIVDFLSALAERYDGDGIADAPGSPQVTVWELYNEPDNIHLRFRGFGVWGNNAAGYARFLATARAALRATNPNALVAIGGLGHEDTPNFDYNFPQTLFAYIRDNPGDYFDYFNFHYYSSFGHRYAAWGPDISGKTNYLRDMMAGYGLDWPIIVTESGLWSSGGVTIPGSYETQARYVAQLYSRIIALDVAVSMWLQLLDLPPGSPVIVNPERGISDYHGVPKPAHNAYRVATGKLTGVRFDRSLRPAEMGSSQAEGYRFSGPNEGRQLYVVWATDEGATGRLRVKTPAAYVSDKLAAEFPMSPTLAYVAPYLALDADDGTADGWTTVPFGPSPIYVEVARTLTVCPAGPPACNFSDIQTAADAAIEGDTVKVATGVYTAVAPHTSPAGYSGPPVISQVVYLDTSIILRGGYTTT
ncbi:MAG: hypothetical protein ACE5G8_09930, partial [Anaerolineae bacterium]